VPQLSFDENGQPRDMSVKLEWRELDNRWSLIVLAHTQKNVIQGAISKDLFDGFDATELCFAIAALFEDWIDITPAYAIAHFGKRVSQMHPLEVPSGLRPEHVNDASGPGPSWQAQGYRSGRRPQR
jgi:hypothetical protein